MTTETLLALSFGSVLMAFTVSYAMWTKIRCVRFRIDMLNIRSELMAAALDNGAAEDAEFKLRDRQLKLFIDKPEFASWGSFFISVVYDRRKHEAMQPHTDNEKMRHAIKIASDKMTLRLFTHLFGESLFGLCLFLFFVLVMSPALSVRGGLAKARDSLSEFVGEYAPHGIA